jgi:hypothetical protein
MADSGTPNPEGRPLGSTKFTEEIALKLLTDYVAMKVTENKTPYIEEFAVKYMDVDDETVLEYAKRWPSFSAALKKLKTLQKFNLLEGSGAMQIFQLKANHGMIETEKKIVDGNIKGVGFIEED